ncbi:Uma2 family endonuclease [bacterium]|nr:Uma2 family endonuclease [bacterium]
MREYWIIDRQQQRVAVYSLGEDRRYHAIAPLGGKDSFRGGAGILDQARMVVAGT